MSILALAMLLALAPPAPAQEIGGPSQAREDPEARPEGRHTYLGREIARTMHWTGAPWLLRETRERDENGIRLRQWLDVRPGQVVCDLGSGNGYHSLPLAESVAPGGRVLAVDLQPEMLVMLSGRAEARGIENIETIEATVDDPRLAPGSCDLVLMVDVYHELSHPVRVLGHLRRALRERGRVVLVEFRSEDPKVPIKRLHKMSKAQILNELAAGGFRLAAEFDGLPWQHVMSFERAPATAELDLLAAREVARGWWRAMASPGEATLLAFYAERVALLGEESLDLSREQALAWRRNLQGAALPAGELAAIFSEWELEVELQLDDGSQAGQSAFCTARGPRGGVARVRLARTPDGPWQVLGVGPVVLVALE